MEHIPRLGLTGGIGSGKSTALAFFRELGAATTSSDDIVHGLYSRGDVVDAVRAKFGEQVIDGAGGVSRPALAAIVFRDQEALRWLEDLLHPHVRATVEKWTAEQERRTPPPALLVVEVPLLFETGFADDFDYTMLVTAPPEVRRRRLSAKLTDSEFSRRLAQQMPEEEKAARADFVFHNTGSRKALREFVREVVARILAGPAPAACVTGRPSRVPPEAMARFRLSSSYAMTGDQPEAVAALSEGVLRGDRYQTLLGVTGSGKTFTMANVIERVQKPTLVIAHNKTLAAQLCNEFREFFPDNAVEYFVSYYDYYQPEAYVPAQDLYIEKDSSINDEIDRLRHAATTALFLRRDVIIVASVSCIYGLGSPEEYLERMVLLRVGETADRDEVLRKLVAIQYARNDFELARGRFRVRGDSLEVWPASQDTAVRIQFWGDEVERIAVFDPVGGEVLERPDHVAIYPATHFVTNDPAIERALVEIERELEERCAWFESQGKMLEAHRLRQRTRYDMEMLRELGYCNGIENYSRILLGREPGATPSCLLDYFPDDFLCFIDESHMTLPQLQGMYEGDRSRKQTLVDYGFRLPSALDNRPLRLDEFLARVPQIIFVSATPGEFELANSVNVVEQVIRPTGLVDPKVEVRPTAGQIDDLMNEIRRRVEKDQRVLVTTLTKRMAEDLTDFLLENGFRVRYLHSEIDTLERIQIVRELRLGEFDVLVGINLLREGLDLPEVSLVAILDADKEGFLRGRTSLIQTIGRAARHVEGTVIMYADHVTEAMRAAIDETERRRARQIAYNEAHGITPRSVVKAVSDIAQMVSEAAAVPRGGRRAARAVARKVALPSADLEKLIAELEAEMFAAADELKFEYAAKLRDEIRELSRELARRKAAVG